MKSDRHREAGFYWVRFQGEIIVAEFTDGKECIEDGLGNTTQPHWHIPGTSECWKNSDVCELLSGRLERSGL